jgi:hypothetical protein
MMSRPDMSTEQKPDLLAAGIALSKARSVLELIVFPCRQAFSDLPETQPGTLSQAIHTALAEIDRAAVAIGETAD